MARLNFTGFEHGDLSELRTITGTGISVSTTQKRSGDYALRCEGGGGSAGSAFLSCLSAIPPSGGRTIYRTWVRFAALPSSDGSIVLAYADDSNNQRMTVRVNTDGTAKMFAGVTDLGTIGTFGVDQWYCLRADIETTNLSNCVVKVYLDSDTPVLDLTGVTLAGRLASAGFYSHATSTFDVYWDDIAINSATGTVENALPSPTAKIVRLDIDGNNSLVGTQGTDWDTGPSTGGTMWQMLDENPPNDATDYIELIVNSTGATNRVVDFHLAAASTAGIGASDTINVVSANDKVRAETSSSCNRLHRLKSQSGGTTVESPTRVTGSTTWATNLMHTSGHCIPGLISYTDPQSGGAWTPALLDTAIIGTRSSDAAPDLWMTKLWLLVEYEPPAAVVAGPVLCRLSPGSLANLRR